MGKYMNDIYAVGALASKQKMTAEQATHFDTFSVANATIVAEATEALGCGCMPYTDVFTYNRWQAQGWQGQKGIHITTWVPVKDKVTGLVTGKVPHTSVVFCRHQVKVK